MSLSFHIQLFILVSQLLLQVGKSLHGRGTACFDKKTEASCIAFAACKWAGTGCTCGSQVPSDIMFVVDITDSLYPAEFAAEKEFILSIIQDSVSSQVRLGVIAFNTVVDQTIIPAQFNNSHNNPTNLTEISSMIRTRLTQPVGGRTDITLPMETALQVFSTQSPPRLERYKLIVLLTDGGHNALGVPNPCSPQKKAFFQQAIHAAGVRVLAIGVGFNVDNSTMLCLVNNPQQDYAVVQQRGVDLGALNAVRRQVEEATCPDNFNVTVTEVSLTSTSKVGFIELYNHARVNAKVNSLVFGGVVNGSLSDLDVLWIGNTFLALFDLDDTPNIPNCRWCPCVHRTNPVTWCRNALYIGCTSDITKISQATINMVGLSHISQKCRFDKTATLTSWWISVADSGNGLQQITMDEVTYNASFPTVRNGYTYELANIQSDNSIPSNWRESCGSPGDRNATCTQSPSNAPTQYPSGTPSRTPTTSAPSPMPTSTPTTSGPTASPTYALLLLRRCTLIVPKDVSGASFTFESDVWIPGQHPALSALKVNISWVDVNGNSIFRVVNFTNDIQQYDFTDPTLTPSRASVRNTTKFTLFYDLQGSLAQHSSTVDCQIALVGKSQFSTPGIQADAFFQWFPWAMWALFVVFIVVPWLLHRAYANSKMRAQADEDESACC